MHPIAQILTRNSSRFDGARRTLWINLPGDTPWRELVRTGRGDAMFSQDFSARRHLAQAGAQLDFGDFPEPAANPWDAIVLALPREKERLEMMLSCCVSLLAADGCLWLAGENAAGARSAGKRLQPYFDSHDKSDSARHCVLWRACRPQRTGAFEAQAHAQRWRVDVPGCDTPVEVTSWPGVFAHGHLDAGTRLLLEHLPRLDAGARALDFGCGAGVIGACLLYRNPGIDMVLSDSNALACRSAIATLEANGLRGEVLASDGFSELGGRFDLVITNPPFHVGHHSVMALSPALLKPIRNYLTPSGRFVMVANRHLPYRRWLDETFGRHEVLAEQAGFHVLACRNPPSRRQ